MIRQRSFAWLNAAQFLGALNDNVFKLLIIFYLIGVTRAQSATVVATVGVVYILPFILFSHIGGVLADRVSKRDVIVGAKLAEVVIMIAGAGAFFIHSIPLLYACCFLMAAQSAVFGPSKHGILPELVDRDRLTRANGLLFMFTFTAIVAGTPVAAFLSERFQAGIERASVVCVLFAAAGALAALPIRRTPVPGAIVQFSPVFLGEIRRTLRDIRQDSYLFLTVLSSAYFLMIAAFIQLNMIPYGMEVLNLTEERSSYLFVLAAFGIGLSALLASRFSGRNIEFGLVPLGAIGLTVTCILLYSTKTLVSVASMAFMTGLCAGLFTIPLDTFLQIRSPADRLGKILAASNFVGYIGVLFSACLIFFISGVLGLSAADGFLIIGCLTIVLTVGTILVLPDFLVRFLGVLITRTFYRIRTVGLENLPLEGGALLVPNHVTLVDSLLISATQQRRIRFVMFRETYETCWWLRPVFKLMKAIPISETDPPKTLIASLKQARAMLDDGYLVCIFAEGAMSRNGNMRGFKPGFERIVEKTGCPIIPVYIGGGWGSIFSYSHGKPLSTLPREIPYPVTVVFGSPMSATARVSEVRQAVCELSSEWLAMEKTKYAPLGELFVRSARKHWRRQAIFDTTGKSLTCGKTLIGATLLSSKLAGVTRDQDKVGVILPATVAGALANLAITMLGKVPVNLNFTGSAESIASAIEQCGIRTTVSSRAFLSKLKEFTAPAGTIFLEDVMKTVTGKDKLLSLLKALFLRPRTLAHSTHTGVDNLATLIFSSGTTGEPKGIMLSHYNIIANMESFGTILWFKPSDNMCAALPFFHSFGFTCTLWFPLISGLPVCYHPNPLEGDKIAKLVREQKSAVLLATPTFLLTYIRRASPADFQSLRYVITGAEKLRERVADAFEKKFGIAPLEGYGVTETSPVVSLNVPNVDAGRVFQLGTKKGTIGQSVPGVTVKIVDTDGGSSLPPGSEGLLLVKGPNVMMGYLNKPEKTAEVLKDGWYNTGDIARMDDDGFITITDRASRFSKIGGEMVPHIAVEEVYLNMLRTDGRAVVVTSVPDDKRGERLIVLHTDEAGDVAALQREMAASNLPNLWKPRVEDYIRIEAVPILGSGKMDLKQVRQIALELAG